MTTPIKKSWKDRLPGCFGVADLKFARHPFDKRRAKDMATEAFASGASSEDILAAIRDYLISKNAQGEHIDEEMKYARKLKFLA